MSFLVKCRPFYRINFDGWCSEILFPAQQNSWFLANQHSTLQWVLAPSSVGSIWRRECPDISGDVFFGRMPAIALSNSRSPLSLAFQQPPGSTKVRWKSSPKVTTTTNSIGQNTAKTSVIQIIHEHHWTIV
jgi:hypothetical protein